MKPSTRRACGGIIKAVPKYFPAFAPQDFAKSSRGADCGRARRMVCLHRPHRKVLEPFHRHGPRDDGAEPRPVTGKLVAEILSGENPAIALGTARPGSLCLSLWLRHLQLVLETFASASPPSAACCGARQTGRSVRRHRAGAGDGVWRRHDPRPDPGRAAGVWVRDPAYVGTATAVALVTFCVARWREFPRAVLLVADAFALAFFTMAGTRKALDLAWAVDCRGDGVITGVAGGMIRDVLTGEIPLVFRREIYLYATAALCGAVVLVLLQQWKVAAPENVLGRGHAHPAAATGGDPLETRPAGVQSQGPAPESPPRAD